MDRDFENIQNYLPDDERDSKIWERLMIIGPLRHIIHLYTHIWENIISQFFMKHVTSFVYFSHSGDFIFFYFLNIEIL